MLNISEPQIPLSQQPAGKMELVTSDTFLATQPSFLVALPGGKIIQISTCCLVMLYVLYHVLADVYQFGAWCKDLIETHGFIKRILGITDHVNDIIDDPMELADPTVTYLGTIWVTKSVTTLADPVYHIASDCGSLYNSKIALRVCTGGKCLAKASKLQ